MKKIVLISTLALIGLGSAAWAQDGTQAPATNPVVAEAEVTTQAEPTLTPEQARMQEVQCRTSRVTGSRTRVNRVCMTRAEWRASEARTRDNLEDAQGRGSGGYQCTRDQMGGCS